MALSSHGALIVGAERNMSTGNDSSKGEYGRSDDSARVLSSRHSIFVSCNRTDGEKCESSRAL